MEKECKLYHWRALAEDTDERETDRMQGILAAHSYCEAAEKLETYFGPNCIDTMAIRELLNPLDADELIDMNLQDYNKTRKWGDYDTPPLQLDI